MTMLRAVIADDEPLARTSLRLILGDDPDLEVVAECRNGAEALTAIETHRPDLAFLDVQMPELDGFGIVGRLAQPSGPAVIFVTAHDHYARRAYDVAAVDFVSKPLRDGRVHQAVARARERIRLSRLSEPPGGPPESAPLPGMVSFTVEGRVRLIPSAEIDWIDADNAHVVVHLGAGRLRARSTLGSLLRRLDPARFLRIHRSTVVNLSRIRELQPWFHGDYVVILEGGARVRLSRTYRDALARRIGYPL